MRHFAVGYLIMTSWKRKPRQLRERKFNLSLTVSIPPRNSERVSLVRASGDSALGICVRRRSSGAAAGSWVQPCREARGDSSTV